MLPVRPHRRRAATGEDYHLAPAPLKLPQEAAEIPVPGTDEEVVAPRLTATWRRPRARCPCSPCPCVPRLRKRTPSPPLSRRCGRRTRASSRAIHLQSEISAARMHVRPVQEQDEAFLEALHGAFQMSAGRFDVVGACLRKGCLDDKPEGFDRETKISSED